MTDQAMNDTTTPAPITRIEPRNGYGLTSVILGAVGAGLGLIPLLWFLAGPAGIAGLALALRTADGSNGRPRRTKRPPSGAPSSGLAAIGLAIAGFIILQQAVTKLNHDLNNLPGFDVTPSP